MPIRGASGGIDTSDATATAADMQYGKTAYVNGAKITGNTIKYPAVENSETVSAPTISVGTAVT